MPTSYDLDVSEYEYAYEYAKENEKLTANFSPVFRKLYMTQWLYIPTPLVSNWGH